MMSLNNVENTALSTWAGSSNLTTLGNVTTGAWKSTAIGIAFGGTGASTANGALQNLLPSGTNGQTLVQTGLGVYAMKSIYRKVNQVIITSTGTYTPSAGTTDI